MPSGIRATVEFAGAAVCPVVELSRVAETTLDSVRWNAAPAGAPLVTEFSTDADLDAEEGTTRVFSYGSTRRYRLTHGSEVDCPCECLGRVGCVVDRYVAREGRLRLVFHAADFDELQTAVTRLRAVFPDVDIVRFVHAPAERDDSDCVFVDRGKLTDRQFEVLETAYEMGYFERPRRANATAVAAELGVNLATFREHLTTAQHKLLADVLRQ